MAKNVVDEKHLGSLCHELWNYKHSRYYTDLMVHCVDGVVALHKAMVMSVLKTAGVGTCQLLETDTLICPGVTCQEADEALYAIYFRFEARPFLTLLSCYAPNRPDMIDPKQEPKKRRSDLNIADILQCNLKIKPSPVKIKPAPVKIEPKLEGTLTALPQKKLIARLPAKEPVKPYGRKKFRTQCPHCQLIISGKKSYKRHLRNSHQLTMPREGEEVQCQICGKTLKHMQILKTHMKEVHGDRSFTCNLCGLTLSCQRNLNTHMISHTTPSIPCDQCGKLFKRKYAVKNHIKKFHMQIKEKMCDQCDKSFADARHLREHVLAIHDKLKPFGCEMCDFKCARIDNLNTHRKKSHGLLNKLTRAEHDDWVMQGKHPFVKSLVGGADARHKF